MQRATRREFLIQSTAAATALTLSRLVPGCGGGRSAGPRARMRQVPPAAHAPLPDYRKWEDVYRQAWTWDRVVRGAHHVVNCASSCPFNVFVKDGLVLREEQNTVMAANRPGLPDFNPRGCQKGVCFSHLMYSPQRLKYPLERVGARGEGRWRRISWDEALEKIARKIVEVARTDGPDCVVYDSGTANAGYGAPTAGELRLFDILGATLLDGWACVGDMPLGVILTWGLFNVDSTSDDYLNADLILLWLGNPSYTRIPDAHFIWEARYHGSKVVSIAPDYNASTMHCDEWVNLRVGTDSALALGMAHVLVEENLYDRDFVVEQTDLPLLVRNDTGRFLRESDLEKGGREDVFYLWDKVKGRVARAPGSQGLGPRAKLELGDLRPALEGEWDVTLAGGATVRCRTVFDRLRERLREYRPEAVAQVTGIPADRIRRLAREVAAARAVTVFGSWGMMKHYHSDLYQRGILLLLALTGNVGRRGTGIRVGAWYVPSAMETAISDVKPSWWQRLALRFYQPTAREWISHFRDYERKHMYMNVPALMFLYEHAGLKEVVDRPEYHDKRPGKPLPEAMKDSIENEWVPLYPRPGKRPRVYIHTRVNPLRRWPAPHVIERNLWPKLDLIVGINLKMSATAAKSDIVLPACGYYERRGIKYAQSYVPYYAVGEKAIDPLWESRSEWEIAGLLARKIEEIARRENVVQVTDARGKKRELARIYQRWSHGGRFRPEDDREYYEIVTRKSPEFGKIPWDEAASRGAVRVQGLGPFRTHSNFCSDYEPGDTVYPCQWFVQHKQAWPTLTGRQQFYIDHPWYLAAGEELPCHKELPDIGGRYPLRMTGGHTRWSIHSIWRDHELMLRLQRGEPAAWISAEDARKRGVRDGDRIVLFNDVGACELIAKVSPAVQPGQVIVYHAWEPFQFKGWQSNQVPVASPWKALHVAEYGQLHYRFLYAGPHHTPRGTAVDMRRA